jgi:predicted nucleic acid-binding protein
MNTFLLDASTLLKRYAPEKGTGVMNHLFAQARRERLMCLMLGAAEVAAGLARKRNGGLIPPVLFATAMIQLRTEILDAPTFAKLPADNTLIDAAILLLEKHAINANDAIVLRSALDVVIPFRSVGDDLILVASDQRLLKAAQAEGLATFDPETQSTTDLDALLPP